jgi:tellurite resistance protein TehA-like permease
MQRTRKFVLAWVAAFLGLLGIGAGYEIVTLKDKVPNNTISHVMNELTLQYPWLPWAFVIFMGVFFIFWITCSCHWWGKGFWWKKAVYKDDLTTPEDESLRNG